MRRFLPRLTYANIVSSLALFLVLTGGTAVALTGSNTVFSDDITNNEVRTGDVRDDNLAGGGLTSRDVRPNALTGSDVSALTGGDVNDNTLTGADIATGGIQRSDIGNGQVDDSKLSDPGAFTPASLAHPWVNYGGGWAPAAFRKERGRVFIQGLVRVDLPIPHPFTECQNNAVQAGRTIFTLPEGYRPANGQLFDVELATGEHGRVDVLANGQVRCVWGQGPHGYVSLSGINFVAGR